jgi:hypothetical protein
MSASNSGKQKEQLQHYPQVVKRAGIDQLQQDIVKHIQKKYLLTSQEEAIRILETYSSTIQSIVTNSRKSVDVNPVPIMTASSVVCNLPLTHPDRLLAADYESPQPGRIMEEDTAPMLYGCHNVVTNLRTVMSGSVMQLYGLHLDINKLDTQQGLYLRDFSGHTTKINTLVRVKSTNIIFMIPSGLAAGIYRLEIRKRSNSSEALQSSFLPGFIRVII